MPSSEDSSTSRYNTWTLEEFGNLVTAWERATSRPRDADAQNLHDAVYKHFVALRGGSTRRNKAALTSKRSALKFTYLYIRDFDNEQKMKKSALFFELPPQERLDLLSTWKKVNSSLVEITPAMYYGLGRIVSKGGDDEPVVPIRQRQKELQEASATMRSETRPTRASAAGNFSSFMTTAEPKTSSKRKLLPSARATSLPWSMEEIQLLIQAWTRAAELMCASPADQPLSIVHEIHRQYVLLNGGKSGRNLSSLATRRRVLKQSYSRIAAFDKIQAMNGDPQFTNLSVTMRLALLRSWKNVNLLDLSADLYAELHNVIALDARAAALNDGRRSKAAKVANIDGDRVTMKWNRSMKKQDNQEVMQITENPILVSPLLNGCTEQVETKEKESLKMSSHKFTVRSIERPLPMEEILVHPMLSHSTSEDWNASNQPLDDNFSSTKAANDESSVVHQAAALQEPALLAHGQEEGSVATLTSVPVQEDIGFPPIVAASVKDDAIHTNSIETLPVSQAQIDGEVLPVPVDRDQVDVLATKGSGRWGKRKRPVHLDGPNGYLWEIKELEILVTAWETAAILVCNSEPTERKSLNREMYRVFVEMQDGSTVRNSTALAARRSSLKLSYAHIKSFNESQKAKGEPSYHDIPEDKRMIVLRSWKNRNSVDLTKSMFDALGRIIAMDDRLTEIRSLRPPVSPKVSNSDKSLNDTSTFKSGVDSKLALKTAKWTTEESFDLIKACADVMNAPADNDLSQRDREALIFDAFLARRETAGDTETPFRRDLRSMAQQWRYILASYSYIKAYNDDQSEPESPSWFEMSSTQKRAYQQCTNVPVKFVDLDAEMFALVTETSFVGVSTPIATVPSPDVNPPTEAITLRPRSNRKKADAFWSSESESSVAEVSVDGGNDDVLSSGRKGNNWPADEIWRLIQAWEEAAATTRGTKLTSALHETWALFVKHEGSSQRNRTLTSVKNRMIALNSSFLGISAYIVERGSSSAWFDLTADQRQVEIRSWGNKTIIDLDEKMFNSLARIIDRTTNNKADAGKRTRGRSNEYDRKCHIGHKVEKYAVANWSKEELLILSEACGELLEGRRSRRYVFEEEKDRFFRRYEELGGTNSQAAAVGLARSVLDSYEFIYFYNQKAVETHCFTWFELTPTDRESITMRMSKSYRSFSGLNIVDEEIYDEIDKIDAELRIKLGEAKKKTYKPPNDAASSRYVDIELVIENCMYKQKSEKKILSSHNSIESEMESDQEVESSTSDSSSDDESCSSDSGAPIMTSSRPPIDSKEIDENDIITLPRRTTASRDSVAGRASTPLSRKRPRSAAISIDDFSTLSVTEIIQRQTQKLEEAVKRFRKDGADARKEHHDFLLWQLQENFPIDTGHGSFPERVAERQGQALGEIFQRLQQLRDDERARDEELMRQLFGSSGKV
ncbi:uncharacterized protein CCR75_003276 [Bremia lactucae]|uniref:Uncharacterized protein n=1 Tax=Bremia lactucae TaxID=4779 RepID=A0A976IJ21_BRELC|nr:hypothetical protein CCR75_003276 [Bremia lactucae]